MSSNASETTAKLKEVLGRSFDYIICGGGTAGLCLAARLTEDPQISVLVLEAGRPNINDPEILRPGSYGSRFGDPVYDWCHMTVRQEHAGGKQHSWPRGKGLGGSSGINFGPWMKPHASDIDDIEKLGNPGWNWENYQKYSARAATFKFPEHEHQNLYGLDPEQWKSEPGHGPVMVTFPANVLSTELDLQKTLINAGIPIAPDPFGGDPTGVSFTPNSLDPKSLTRSYATTAHHLATAHRPNYTVLCDALVEKLVLEKASQSVLGKAVRFRHEGSSHEVACNREIILAAGTLKTPQILELSGIGLKPVLESLQIPMAIELPVGENVQEHVVCGVTWELRDGMDFETLDVLKGPGVSAEHIKLHTDRQGLYATGLCGFTFISLAALSPPDRVNEIRKLAAGIMNGSAQQHPPGRLEQYQVLHQRLESNALGCELTSFCGFRSEPNLPEAGKKYVTMLGILNHPFSRGTIHCTSGDPLVDPAIDPHYLEEDIDHQMLVEIIKYIRNLATHAPLKNMIAKEVNPGSDVDSDAKLGEWVRQTVRTLYHTCGSASMLPKDKGGVVDVNLKVYGTENIRVVDLSVVPLHFGAHSQASVYAIAEQAADIIR